MMGSPGFGEGGHGGGGGGSGMMVDGDVGGGGRRGGGGTSRGAPGVLSVIVGLPFRLLGKVGGFLWVWGVGVCGGGEWMPMIRVHHAYCITAFVWCGTMESLGKARNHVDEIFGLWCGWVGYHAFLIPVRLVDG